MADPIVERIERSAGLPGLAAALGAAIPAADLWSLLLHAFRGRTGSLQPADVLRRYEQDRFVRPAPGDPRRLAELELLAFSLLPTAFEPLELGPLTPLGTASVLGRLSPDRAVATIRGTEVTSDATNALALEAAVRRRQDPGSEVHLAAALRVVRPQRSADPAALAHFRLLALVSAGPAGESFERTALAAHLSFHAQLAAASGVEPFDVSVTPLDAAGERLCERLDGIRVDRERTKARDYYMRLCLSADSGDDNLADGGFVDWTARLLANAKERLLISGTGLERLAR